MAASDQSTTMKLSPLTAKQAAMPAVAMMIPASSGPITLVRLKVSEFRAMADGRISRGTSSETSEWRAGWLKATIAPRPAAMARMSQMFACPIATSSARSSASTIPSAWLAIISRRRSKRSAATPPSSVSARIGIARQRLTRPSKAADPVVWSTSQFSAI